MLGGLKIPVKNQKEKRVSIKYYPAAIEISSTAIKLLQIARSVKGLAITAASYLPLRSNTQAGSSLKNSLKDLIAESHIEGNEAVTSLPLSKIQVFNYILPNMPANEIESAIAWKLKQNPPAGIPFENLSFNYTSYIQPKDDLNKNIQVMVFAAAKDAVMEHIGLFKELSLEVISLEPKPYATLLALSRAGKIRQDETVLVLELGARESAITVLHLGQPYLIRSLASSGDAFTQAIVNRNQFDWEKAEKLKKQEGLKCWKPQITEAEASGDSSCLFALIGQLEGLAVDVEHTFKYFSHQIMKSQVTAFSRVILCGGVAHLVNLDKFLTDRLGAPAEIFDPFNLPDLPVKDGLSPLVKQESASFSSVMGLAVKDIE